MAVESRQCYLSVPSRLHSISNGNGVMHSEAKVFIKFLAHHRISNKWAMDGQNIQSMYCDVMSCMGLSKNAICNGSRCKWRSGIGLHG